MTAYYNENDSYAAQWLRNLIQANLIAPGYVDERDIRDIKPYELAPYTQCHFFAGIGGWSYACRLAGVPDDFPLWTGSCPCQPFSQAGQQRGTTDERHLWPFWQYLIAQRRPAVVLGEQVAGAIGHGWLDLVFSDLENEGYACGAAVLPACSVGAPHIRQRLWFVADSVSAGWSERRTGAGNGSVAGSGEPRELADGDSSRCRARRPSEASDGRDAPRLEPAGFRTPSELAHSDDARLEIDSEQQARRQRPPAERGGTLGELGKPDGTGLQSRNEAATPERHGHPAIAAMWADLDWLPCTDGKARPTKLGIFPLAHGLQSALDSVLSIQERALMEITKYGQRSGTNAPEVLRMVREGIFQDSRRKEASIGMRGELYASPLLFDFLLGLEAARDGTANRSGGKKAGAEVIGGAMRSVRRDSGVVCASHQRRSERQRADEPPKTLHELSLVLARMSEAHAKAAVKAHAATVRVNLLKGAGNSVVPQVAAEFIKASLG